MDLNHRLRLNNQSKVAVVGSGGKTTLMFQLARDFGSRVICSTSTHMALDQLKGGDQHFIIHSLEDLTAAISEASGQIILFTGPEVEPNRVGSPSVEVLARLSELSEEWNCPLIVEADGARKLPIKAPAEHEPAIPPFVNVVITVIGLSGLGKPLDTRSVHRPELYSELVGLPEGGILESSHLVRGLTSPKGGLKNIPDGVRRILFINQIDSFPNWKAFYPHLNALLEEYSSVSFGVLEDEMLLGVHERVAGVVLAAGGSTRFGEPKQLLDWYGEPLVKAVAKLSLAGGCEPVVVVTGADHDLVSRVLEDLPVIIANNTSWQIGQSSSVRAGIEALPDDIGAVIFSLVDQPRIPEELFNVLRKKHAVNPGPIILPNVDGSFGNPVLFDKSLFDSLTLLDGDKGGRLLFDQYPPLTIEWEDASSQEDIDTPDDYQRIRFSEECED